MRIIQSGVSATDRILLNQTFIAKKPHFIDAQSQEELADSYRQNLAVWVEVQ